MSKITQTSIVEQEIDKQLEEGMTNVSEIYTKVVEATGVPRPTVRRTARQLKIKLDNKVKILSSFGNDSSE